MVDSIDTGSGASIGGPNMDMPENSIKNSVRVELRKEVKGPRLKRSETGSNSPERVIP